MRNSGRALLLFFGLWFSPFIHAKDKPVFDIAPISVGSVTYSLDQTTFLCENGKITVCGYNQTVEARETGQILWQTKIYKVVFNQKKENRLQMILPVSLKLDGSRLVVKDEKGLVYKLNAKTGRILNRKRTPMYYTK